MVAKFCSRSHGQPVPGVRSAAMISISRLMSREGVMRSSKLGRADPSATTSACDSEASRGSQPRLAKSPESVLPSDAQWPDSSALRLASNMNQTRRSA